VSAALGLVALALAALQRRFLDQVVVEGLVLAILLGMALRSISRPGATVEPGVDFTAREVLEAAVFLLGASVDLPLLLAAGPSLAVGIVLLVCVGLATSYGIGRWMGLPHNLALLVACGNSICGNSAIAAVAPVIRASKEHVASAIAFTAILGVGVVVALPFLVGPLTLSDYQYGVLAGLTVYAVPQVLAAAFPVSVLSGQVGTLVKLVRVLMLGPVVLLVALTHHARGADGAATAVRPSLELRRVVPWFIAGFLVLAVLRSSGIIPGGLAAVCRQFSGWLTVGAMAALGLGVDVRAIHQVGRPVIVTVTASLLVLVVLALVLIRSLSIG